MSAPLNWDDAQYFVAVVERGSIGAAAKWLRVNHSTVLRRVSNLETTLSVRLFDRLPSGYALTAEGQELAANLAGIAQQFETAQRQVTGGSLELRGNVRLTAPETLVRGMLMSHLAEFRHLHPQLQLELVVNSSLLNLTQREADVAVRGTNTPPENLVGRRVGQIRTALYASRGYLQSRGSKAGASDHLWVGPDESLAHLESAKWIRQHVPPPQIVLKVDSLTGLVDAVAAGLGVGWLLCPLAEPNGDLVRIQEPMPAMDTQVWVLTHPDLKGVARVRALADFLYARLSIDAALLHR